MNSLLLPLLALPLASTPEVLIVVGPSNHPPGTHEVAKGADIIGEALAKPLSGTGIASRTATSWSNDLATYEGVKTVVFLGDLFPLSQFPDQAANMATMQKLVDRGVGVVCIHYATGVLGTDTQDGDHPLLRWMGGYFANPGSKHHESIARIFEAAKIEPAAPSHPISRGWKAFQIDDEPYINNYFGAGGRQSGVTILATSLLPPEGPKVEPVAWCIQRKDGGRGFAVVMPHFVRNWRNDDLRTLILNGIIWTAGREVPTAGFATAKPEI